MSDRAQKAIARVLAIARLSQETEQTEGVDGFDDAIADLVAEMECDNIFSTFRGEKSETESAEDVVVRVFHTEEIKLCGNTVFAGDVKCGTLSWLVHWDPPAIAANCTVHSGCYCTAPIHFDEQELVQWLGQAISYKDGQAHGRFVPKGTYNKRRLPV